MSEEINGFSFPFHLAETQEEDADDSSPGRPLRGIAQERGVDKIRQNIQCILLTGVGERVMRRDYGGGLRQLVHDPNNEALRAIVQHQIAKSIGQWEPQVLLTALNISQQGGTLIVELHYVIRRTQQPQALTVPIPLGGL